MRLKIYTIIEKDETNNLASKLYDIVMLCIIIIISIIPLAFKDQNNTVFIIVDQVSALAFVIDYILRWLTADIRLKSKCAFVKFPITPMAIIDLLAILPTFNLVSSAFRLLKILRAIKVFRIFKTLRYSKNFKYRLITF